MQKILRKCALLFAISLPLAASAATASSGAWPQQPVRIIVGYAPGGALDTVARLVALKLTDRVNQSILVVNKPGASGVVAEEYLHQSAPDGYTMLLDSGPVAINAVLHDMPFNPIKNFVPITQVTSTPLILVVRPASPLHTFADFIAAARKTPGSMTYASPGVGTANHLGTELLSEREKIKLVHVPYNGGTPAATAIMSGQVDVSFSLASTALPYLQGKTLRALAIASPKRVPYAPDVPTLAESGMPNLFMAEWSGIFLPHGTPPAIVDQIAAKLQAVMADPDTQARLRKLGLDPVGSTRPAFAAFAAEEGDRWTAVIKEHNIKVK